MGDKRDQNKNTHDFHFRITLNGCEFCLLTPSAVVALPICLF